jgi:hypothetical protein
VGRRPQKKVEGSNVRGADTPAPRSTRKRTGARERVPGSSDAPALRLLGSPDTPPQLGLQQTVEVAVEHRLDVAGLVLGP